MCFSLGGYRPPSQASSASLQRGSADELDKLLLLQPSLPRGVSCRGCTSHMHHRSQTLLRARSPGPALCSHAPFWSDHLVPDPSLLPEQLAGFHPCCPACSWGCKQLDSRRWDPWKRHYTSPNHASGTPGAVHLGPGYRSPITYFSIVTASLGNLKFNCTGHLERLGTLKLVEQDVDSHLMSPHTGRAALQVMPQKG